MKRNSKMIRGGSVGKKEQAPVKTAVGVVGGAFE